MPRTLAARTSWRFSQDMSGAAVVIGASGGIGAALVAALEDEGGFAQIHGFGRSLGGRGAYRPGRRSEHRSGGGPGRQRPRPVARSLSRPDCSTMVIVGRKRRIKELDARLAGAELRGERDRTLRLSPSISCRFCRATGRRSSRRIVGAGRQHRRQPDGGLVRLSRIEGGAQHDRAQCGDRAATNL